MKIRFIYSILVILIANSNLLFPQIFFSYPKNDSTKDLSPLENLQNDIFDLIQQTGIEEAFIGVSIHSLDLDKELMQINKNKNFIPASIQKLFTTSTTLRYLGNDYKFQTRMYIDGKVNDDGILEGDIIIRGFGDPSLSDVFHPNNSDSVFKYFIKLLDSLGINQINGNIIGDDNFFDDEYYPMGWQIDDAIYSYASQISALSINRNSVRIILTPAKKVNYLCNIKSVPDISYYQIDNQAITSENEQRIKISREPGTNIITISGLLPLDINDNNNILDVTIDNPTLYFLNIFKNKLLDNNINLNGLAYDIDNISILPDYSSFKEYYTFFSPSLDAIIKKINHHSLNLEAEMLLKTLGREIKGFGSTENGIYVIKQFLAKINIDTNQLSLYDGSGLSRLNYVSPNEVIKLLDYIYSSDYYEVFKNSLAQPGQQGTLQRRFKKTAAQNKVWAKTGTMNSISNICGYTLSRDGEPIAFAIMIMNFTNNLVEIQNLQDLIIMRLTAFTRNPELYQKQ